MTRTTGAAVARKGRPLESRWEPGLTGEGELGHWTLLKYRECVCVCVSERERRMGKGRGTRAIPKVFLLRQGGFQQVFLAVCLSFTDSPAKGVMWSLLLVCSFGWIARACSGNPERPGVSCAHDLNALIKTYWTEPSQPRSLEGCLKHPTLFDVPMKEGD